MVPVRSLGEGRRVALEATGHCWKNLFATLAAAGRHVVVLNPLVARRFQDASLERTKTDAIDAQGLACLVFEKRPTPSRLRKTKLDPNEGKRAERAKELVD